MSMLKFKTLRKLSALLAVVIFVGALPNSEALSATIPQGAMKTLAFLSDWPYNPTTSSKLQLVTTTDSSVTRVVFYDGYQSKQLDMVTSYIGQFTSKEFTLGEGTHYLYAFPLDANGNIMWQNGIGIDDPKSYGKTLTVSATPTIPAGAMKTLTFVNGWPSNPTTETSLQLTATAVSSVAKVVFYDGYMGTPLGEATLSNGCFTSKTFKLSEGKHYLYAFPVNGTEILWQNGIGIDDGSRSYGKVMPINKNAVKSQIPSGAMKTLTFVGSWPSNPNSESLFQLETYAHSTVTKVVFYDGYMGKSLGEATLENGRFTSKTFKLSAGTHYLYAFPVEGSEVLWQNGIGIDGSNSYKKTLSVADASTIKMSQAKESLHFVVDISDSRLMGNVSPKNLMRWLSRMDIAYDLLCQLVGANYLNGQKIHIVESTETYGALWVIFGNPNIYIQANGVTDTLKGINSLDGYDWGFLHELGHLFDVSGNWNSHAEAFASFKAMYVLDKTGDTVRRGGEVGKAEILYDHFAVGYKAYMNNPSDVKSGNDWVWFLAEIVKEIGWTPFEKTFRSYIEGYDNYKTLKSTPTDGAKFHEFLDRVSMYSGRNVRAIIPSNLYAALAKVYADTR